MILRPCICIPTYNNAVTIRWFVEDCLRETPYPILLVDDGSDVPVTQLLAGLSNSRLHVIRFERNKGKGAALQEAFRFAVAKNYTHLIAIDGDGQHLASEIPKLLDAALQNPWALIIGKRKLTNPAVPSSTKFGRLFSNFWVKYQTGKPIQDSQSGFRIYPLFHVQNLKFLTSRYEFEIEVLIRLLWKKISIQEVEVDVYYPPAGERVSHFRKFADNVRISLLNTMLVVLSLLHENRSSAQMAVALGMGVFVGCTPFYGFHTPIILALAFLLRFNAPLAWIGTQISFPLIAPVLIAASVMIGKKLVVGSSFTEWLVGSLVLGVLLGGLTGLLTWIAAKQMKSSAKKRPWTGKSRGGAVGHWILKAILQIFGIRAVYFCLGFIVPYFFVFAPNGRKASFEYWKITRPDLSRSKRALRVMGHFYRFGTVLLDQMAQGIFKEARFKTESEGYENIHALLESGSGSVLLGAHVGSWNIAIRYLPNSDLSNRFMVVQYASFGAEARANPSGEVQTLWVNEEESAILKIHGELKNGGMICMMGDRAMDQHVELVSFFDKLAPFASTPIKIAATSQVSAVISFGFKKDLSTYRFIALPPREYDAGAGENRDAALLRWVQEYAFELEKMMRRFPEQWFNFYPFWSSVPFSGTSSPHKRARNRLWPEGRKQTGPTAGSEPGAAPNGG